MWIILYGLFSRFYCSILLSISVRRHDSKGDVCCISADDADGRQEQVVDIQFGDVEIPRCHHRFTGYMTAVRRTECRKLSRIEVAAKTENSHTSRLGEIKLTRLRSTSLICSIYILFTLFKLTE